MALVLGIIAVLFAVIFKVLPDGHVRWKECLIGAGFTSLLFAIGKFAITFYLGSSDLGATYGASASIVILLTWIYYSSIILYFGAEFTKVFARFDGHEIRPNEHAVLLVRQEVVKDSGTPEPQPADARHEWNPLALKDKLIDSVTHFVDTRLHAIREEIERKVSGLLSPAVYYLLLAIFGFGVITALLLIAGHFLNEWLNSDYLGYIVLMAFLVLMVVLFAMMKKQSQSLIRKLLFKVARQPDEKEVVESGR